MAHQRGGAGLIIAGVAAAGVLAAVAASSAASGGGPPPSDRRRELEAQIGALNGQVNVNINLGRQLYDAYDAARMVQNELVFSYAGKQYTINQSLFVTISQNILTPGNEYTDDMFSAASSLVRGTARNLGWSSLGLSNITDAAIKAMFPAFYATGIVAKNEQIAALQTELASL